MSYYINKTLKNISVIILFVGLLCAWVIAAWGTIKGLKSGHIMKNPVSAPVVID